MTGYYVTRQSNYYDDGAYSVEIARELDFAGPGALVEKYPGEFSEHDDPREAAETAISIAQAWRADVGRKSDGGLPFRCFTIAGNSFVYPTVADARTTPELRAWARDEYNALPKCEHCGGIGAVEYTNMYGDEMFACCESHAELIASDRYPDDDESAGEN